MTAAGVTFVELVQDAPTCSAVSDGGAVNLTNSKDKYKKTNVASPVKAPD